MTCLYQSRSVNPRPAMCVEMMSSCLVGAGPYVLVMQ